MLRRDYRELESYKYLFGVGAIVLLALPALPVIGQTVNGARLWVHFGPLQFQPGELAKIMLIVFLAGYLREKREVLAQGRLKDFGPLLVIWGGAMLVLVETNDLGSALLYFGIFLAMLYVATGRALFVGVGLGALRRRRRSARTRRSRTSSERVTIWLHPWTRHPVHVRAQRQARAPPGLRELPAREVAVLDRGRRLRRHGARARHVHDRRGPPLIPVPEDGLHLLRARAGARADRRLRRCCSSTCCSSPAASGSRSHAQDGFSKLAAAGLTFALRAPGVHHRRRDPAADPADRDHAAARLVRRLERRRELHARRRAAA